MLNSRKWRFPARADEVPFDEFFQWLEDQDIWHEPADSPRSPKTLDSKSWISLEVELDPGPGAPAESDDT